MTRPPLRVERVVVHAVGDAATANRIAERLPAALERAVRGAARLDESRIRALLERAAREAVR
ncbi:MAG TPA: hypothetical protein VGH24_06130 [Solirubrobacteraceae bacterium]